MRGKVVGVIEGLNEILIKFDTEANYQRNDIVDVQLLKDKRSKNANAMYWILNGKLAEKLCTSGEKIYKHQVRDMSVRDVMLMETKAVEDFTRRWTSNHLGRFVETRESQQEGKTIVLAYYGSSDFNRAEMSRLMENLKGDLKLYGVPYDEEEIERLVKLWGNTHQA